MTEDKPKNEALEVSTDRIFAENERLKRQLQEALDVAQEVKKENDELKAFRESEERGKLREDLRSMGCTYGVEELEKLGLKELSQLKTHYQYFNPPFKSGADFAPSVRKNIYDALYDKYVPLEERIKQMREG